MGSQPQTRRSFRFESFQIDSDNPVLLRNGKVVKLPPKAVEILLVLLENAGKPMDREVLLRTAWPETFVEDTNLAHHISVLRKALGNDEAGGAYIETIPKRGYRFVGKVHEASNGSVAADKSAAEET